MSSWHLRPVALAGNREVEPPRHAGNPGPGVEDPTAAGAGEGQPEDGAGPGDLRELHYLDARDHHPRRPGRRVPGARPHRGVRGGAGER